VEDALQYHGKVGPLGDAFDRLPVHREVAELFDELPEGGALVLLRRGVKPVAKRGIGEVVRHALAVEEGQVCVLHVSLAPPHRGRVERDDDGLVARVLGPPEEARCHVGVGARVELEPPGRVAEFGRDLLHHGRCRGTGDERDAEVAGGPRAGEFAVLVDDGLDANGREEDRDGKSLAEEFDGEVALGDVPQHPGDDTPSPEGLAVARRGVLAPCAPGDVGAGLRRESVHRSLAQLVGRDREVGALVSEHPASVHFALAVRAVRFRGVVHGRFEVVCGVITWREFAQPHCSGLSRGTVSL
jgi:hypothetical protein